jgi:hypothetical protein
MGPQNVTITLSKDQWMNQSMPRHANSYFVLISNNSSIHFYFPQKLNSWISCVRIILFISCPYLLCLLSLSILRSKVTNPWYGAADWVEFWTLNQWNTLNEIVLNKVLDSHPMRGCKVLDFWTRITLLLVFVVIRGLRSTRSAIIKHCIKIPNLIFKIETMPNAWANALTVFVMVAGIKGTWACLHIFLTSLN